MQLFTDLSGLPSGLRGAALTIGNFDGVHRGHAELIGVVKQLAAKHQAPAIIFTFDPHPARILRPAQAPTPLTWIDRKADLLAELGVDAVIAYRTDQELLNLSYRDFFQQIVIDAVGARAMAEGPNFFFGQNRMGTPEKLHELCRRHHVELRIVDPLIDSEEYISSSRIRQLIGAGRVADAARMLTRPYRIRGMVTHGAARGGLLGFPTANLGAIDTLIPAAGVYAGRTYVDARAHWSAIHIGPNPTFGDNVLKVESHLLDYEGSLYGRVIEVDFIARLRDIHRFETTEDLLKQLEQDIENTRQIARQN